MSYRRGCLIVAAIAALACPVRGDVLYVDDDAPPGGDGLSWETAYRSLRVALEAAAMPGAAVNEIRVAQGTYRLVQTPPGPESNCCEVHDSPGCNAPSCEATVCLYFPECCDTAWDTVCVQLAEVACDGLCDEDPLPPPPTYLLPDGMALQGGFAGFGAPDPDARDVNGYPSILCGDVGNDDDLYPESCCSPHDTPGCADASPDGACEAAVCADLPYCCETAWDLLCAASALSASDCPLETTCPEIANNAQVVTAIETGPTTVLDGVTVTRGAAGVFVVGGAPSIVDCTFVDNRSYGLRVYEGSPAITRCTFSGNAARPLTLYQTAGAVTDCLLTGNASPGIGGGLSANGDNTIVGCTVSGNRARYSGGGVYVSGGTVTGCTITDNKAGPEWAGGGGSIGGSQVIDCLFSGNEAGYAGGGLMIEAGTNLIGCTFESNAASGNGGGVFVSYIYPPYQYVPQITNCLFIDNSGECGGGMCAYDPVILTNCTFSHNAAAGGGALCAETDEITVINCVLWGDIPDEVGGGGISYTELAFSDVQGGFPGNGNIDADPQFVDPAAGNYRLGPDSPCIDAGRSHLLARSNRSRPVLCDTLDLDQDGDTIELIPIDFDGRLRFADDPDTPDTGCAAGAVVNMGAYEFGAPPEGDRVVCADVDGDGEVGVTDLLLVFAAWGPCSDPCCLADVAMPYNECWTYGPPDGVVDVVDFYAITSWWGL